MLPMLPARVGLLLVLVAQQVNCAWYNRNPAPPPTNMMYPVYTTSNINGPDQQYYLDGKAFQGAQTPQHTLYIYTPSNNTWVSVIINNPTEYTGFCQISGVLLAQRYWLLVGGSCSTNFAQSYPGVGGTITGQLDLLTFQMTDVTASILNNAIPLSHTGYAFASPTTSTLYTLGGRALNATDYKTIMQGDMWSFNCTGLVASTCLWYNLSSSIPRELVARWGGNMVYLPATNQMLTIGGTTDLAVVNFATDSYLYNLGNASWITVSLAKTPIATLFGQAILVKSQSQVLHYGGIHGQPACFYGNESYMYDVASQQWNTWSISSAPNPPGMKLGHTMRDIPGYGIFSTGGSYSACTLYPTDTQSSFYLDRNTADKWITFSATGMSLNQTMTTLNVSLTGFGFTTGSGVSETVTVRVNINQLTAGDINSTGVVAFGGGKTNAVTMSEVNFNLAAYDTTSLTTCAMSNIRYLSLSCIMPQLRPVYGPASIIVVVSITSAGFPSEWAWIRYDTLNVLPVYVYTSTTLTTTTTTTTTTTLTRTATSTTLTSTRPSTSAVTTGTTSTSISRTLTTSSITPMVTSTSVTPTATSTSVTPTVTTTTSSRTTTATSPSSSATFVATTTSIGTTQIVTSTSTSFTTLISTSATQISVSAFTSTYLTSVNSLTQSSSTSTQSTTFSLTLSSQSSTQLTVTSSLTSTASSALIVVSDSSTTSQITTSRLLTSGAQTTLTTVLQTTTQAAAASLSTSTISSQTSVQSSYFKLSSSATTSLLASSSLVDLRTTLIQSTAFQRIRSQNNLNQSEQFTTMLLATTNNEQLVTADQDGPLEPIFFVVNGVTTTLYTRYPRTLSGSQNSNNPADASGNVVALAIGLTMTFIVLMAGSVAAVYYLRYRKAKRAGSNANVIHDVSPTMMALDSLSTTVIGQVVGEAPKAEQKDDVRAGVVRTNYVNMRSVVGTDMKSRILATQGTNMTGFFNVGNTTFMDPSERVVAVPGYLELNMSAFKLIKNIGKGGDGRIDLAEIVDEQLVAATVDRKLELKVSNTGVTLVAVKTLLAKQALESDELTPLDKFKQELSIITALQGVANIVTLVGYCEQPALAMIMKSYDGSLASLVMNTDITVLPFMEMARQLTFAMVEMHKNGITHCDLKPGNILYLKQHKGKYSLHVTDFGISQVRLASEKVRTRRNVRVPAASITYASPELLARFLGPEEVQMELVVNVTINLSGDKKMVTADEALPSRDIYAFSVILWELISRDMAWKGLPSEEVYQMVTISGQRPPLPPKNDWLQHQQDTVESRKAVSVQSASTEGTILPTDWTNNEFLVESFELAAKTVGADAMKGLLDLIEAGWDADPDMRPSAVIIAETLELIAQAIK